MQEVENVYQDAYYRTKCLKGLFVHDISNLFQIICNSIELCESLLIGEENKENIVDYFRLIVQQLNRGKKLIRNVKNLSELEEYEMILSPVDVFSNLRSAISFTRTSYPKKDVDIEIISDYRNLYTMANELLTEAFENIITNSINYNKNKIIRIVVIISVIDDDYVKIEFKDNGIGIDDDRKEHIFRETRMKKRHSKGMGIGLSLVAKLIEIYGGNIWVEDRISGDSSKGCNFIILIPLAKKSVIIDE
ncbi:MAG: sensor histidine kinase [Promethearchaeota archaeon]|jgi:signal transduction histidine kinase